MRLADAVDGFLLARRADGYSPHTLADYARSLRRLAGYLDNPPLERVTPEDLRRFMAWLRDGYTSARGGRLSPHTIANHWCAVRSFFGWCLSEGLVGERPDAGLRQPRFAPATIEPFTREEVTRLLRAAEYTAPAKTATRKGFRMRRPTARRDTALVVFLLDTAVRVSECARLTVGDVDMETGEVTVKPHGSGRKSKGRHVYLGNAARRRLWRYLVERDADPDAPLFVTIEGRPMNRDSIRQLLARLGERAGVRGVYPHRLRHTAAVTFLRNGGDVFSLQRMLGHSTLDMVRRYVALADADTAAAHRRASPADGWRLKGRG